MKRSKRNWLFCNRINNLHPTADVGLTQITIKRDDFVFVHVGKHDQILTVRMNLLYVRLFYVGAFFFFFLLFISNSDLSTLSNFYIFLNNKTREDIRTFIGNFYELADLESKKTSHNWTKVLIVPLFRASTRNDMGQKMCRYLKTHLDLR